MTTNVSGTAAPFTSAPAELRASLNNLLTTPRTPKPVPAVDLNLTAAQLDQRIVANRQLIAFDVLVMASLAGLDDDAADQLAAEFLQALTARLDAYAASLVGGAL